MSPSDLTLALKTYVRVDISIWKNLDFVAFVLVPIKCSKLAEPVPAICAHAHFGGESNDNLC